MDRNVVRYVRSTGDTDEDPPPHEKLVKYFPEAALALYVAVDPMLRQAAKGNALEVLLWAFLGLSAVFCWLYLTRFWKIERRWQKSISVVALVIYVAAIGGPFAALIDGYKTLYGSIAALVFTTFIIFIPAPTKPDAP